MSLSPKGRFELVPTGIKDPLLHSDSDDVSAKLEELVSSLMKRPSFKMFNDVLVHERCASVRLGHAPAHP